LTKTKSKTAARVAILDEWRRQFSNGSVLWSSLTHHKNIGSIDSNVLLLLSRKKKSQIQDGCQSCNLGCVAVPIFERKRPLVEAYPTQQSRVNRFKGSTVIEQKQKVNAAAVRKGRRHNAAPHRGRGHKNVVVLLQTFTI
jgi:hypothetical protein